MDWGSAVFAPELDLILRFSGGHSAYSGTAPQVYDVKTDRYSHPVRPGVSDRVRLQQRPGPRRMELQGQPVDDRPHLQVHRLRPAPEVPGLRAARVHLLLRSRRRANGRAARERNPVPAELLRGHRLRHAAGGRRLGRPAPGGGAGLWRLDAAVAHLEGAAAQRASCRRRAPTITAWPTTRKRDRLLLFSDLGKNKGDVAAYDLKTGEAQWLDAGEARSGGRAVARDGLPAGRWTRSWSGPTSTARGQALWPLYDCAKNAWFGARAGGRRPDRQEDSSTTRWA